MKATVDDSCIACGLCVDVCPEVFKMPDGAEIAEVIVDEVPEADQGACREAADGCPADAIQLTD